MKRFIKIFLLITNVISCASAVTFGIFGIFAEILNPPVFEKILAELKIPLDFDNFVTIGCISVIILIVTYFIRKRFF